METTTRRKEQRITIGKNYCVLHIKSNAYGKVKVLFDFEDLDKVQKYIWSIAWTGRKLYVFNARRQSGKTIYLHRLIMGCPNLVDHRNGDTTDNRRRNLRTKDDRREAFVMNNNNKRKSKRYQKLVDEYFIDITVNNLSEWLLD